jgi:hypothetical protein
MAPAQTAPEQVFELSPIEHGSNPVKKSRLLTMLEHNKIRDAKHACCTLHDLPPYVEEGKISKIIIKVNILYENNLQQS